MSFVEEIVSEEDGGVIDDWHLEIYVFGPENGSIAEELENAHAVFNYMRQGTHFD